MIKQSTLHTRFSYFCVLVWMVALVNSQGVGRPSATITYDGDGGSAFISADTADVSKECRGLDGSRGVTYVNLYSDQAENGQPAFGIRFYSEWGCEGNILVDLDYYYDEGLPLTDSAGVVMKPKSAVFVPIQ